MSLFSVLTRQSIGNIFFGRNFSRFVLLQCLIAFLFLSFQLTLLPSNILDLALRQHQKIPPYLFFIFW